MDIGTQARDPALGRARLVAIGLLVLISLQMIVGALVAGLDAGRTYTDWPLMAGEFLPSGYWLTELGWRSLIEGREATQFNHRILAYMLWLGSLAALFVYRRSALAPAFALLTTLVTLQAAWGIFTLVNTAPMSLALIHQGLGGLVLLAGVKLMWRANQMPAK
jgi:cytochrome c oxidase assembly protein subunit 15